MAYRAVDHYVYERVRYFLRHRHNVSTRGAAHFSDPVVFGELGVVGQRDVHIGDFRELIGEVCRKAGWSKRACGFDERGRETTGCQ